MLVEDYLIVRFSITTDIRSYKENASEVLIAFGRAGFDSAHWCQNWKGKLVLYDHAFAEEVVKCITDNNLTIPDVHGYVGIPIITSRKRILAGNINRIEFARAIGADILVIHLPLKGAGDSLARACKDIADLLPSCKKNGVRLAIENLNNPAHNHEFFDTIFDEFSSNFVGFCYDAGHSLLANQEDFIERYSSRLIATHLHDNDGTSDQHLLCHQGLVDWKRIIRVIKASDYTGTLNLEIYLPKKENLDTFCAQALASLTNIWV